MALPRAAAVTAFFSLVLSMTVMSSICNGRADCDAVDVCVMDLLPVVCRQVPADETLADHRAGLANLPGRASSRENSTAPRPWASLLPAFSTTMLLFALQPPRAEPCCVS